MNRPKKPQAVDETLVSPRVAVAWTGITRARLDELIRAGAVPVERIKGKPYVDVDALERLLERGAR